MNSIIRLVCWFYGHKKVVTFWELEDGETCEYIRCRCGSRISLERVCRLEWDE